jgi:hypothetical protein
MGVGMIILLLIACIPGWYPSSYRPFMISLALAGVVAMNQQVITGVQGQPHHYYWYFIHPLAVLVLVLFAGVVLRPFFRKLHPVAMMTAYFLLMGGLLLCGIKYQWDSYGHVRENWGHLQHSADILAFLNTREPGTVYASDFLRELVPVYTHDDVYYADNGFDALVSDQSELERYFFELWLQGVTPTEAAKAFPTSRRVELSSRLHGLYFRDAAGSLANIPDREVASAIAAYRSYDALSLSEKLHLHPLRYVVLSVQAPLTEALKTLEAQSRKIFEDRYYSLWDVNTR